MNPPFSEITDNPLFWLSAVSLALSVAMFFMVMAALRRARGAAGEQARFLLDMQERTLRAVREAIADSREEAHYSARQTREEIGGAVRDFSEGVQRQMALLTRSNEERFDHIRDTVDARLRGLQEDNAARLDQMRQTVDEKLQGTLERRLGESFALVCERLEQVHAGLGEMRTLAGSVGDLKRVLTNVKTRGSWGEIQLGNLLEQLLTAEQYDENVATGENPAERVEFAIRLPGRDELEREPVWLPIDAKFPQEDYLRLLEAQERADPRAAEAAGRALEVRIRQCARDICVKYLAPPKTTDFAIMFLPTEGLYAEVVRRTGLTETIQRDCRVIVAGPTTLAALLNSLQMGFRTLAIERRSSEVWKLLGAVKSEFGKFTEILDGVQKKLAAASDTIEDAARKTRTIERKLRKVEEIPAPGGGNDNGIGNGNGGGMTMGVFGRDGDEFGP